MIYPLAPNPIFWTLQGEGHLRGFQMCFVRLGGCSVGCPNCDTNYRPKEKATAEEIAERADAVTPKTARDRWAWITGGEPTDHDLAPLISALRAKRFSIAVATSGHRRVIPPVDWLSVSPHDPSKWVQTYGSEVKIVPGLNGFGIEDFLEVHPDSQTDYLYRYFSPLSIPTGEVVNGRSVMQESPVSLQACLQALKSRPNWSLSRQDHLYWGAD